MSTAFALQVSLADTAAWYRRPNDRTDRWVRWSAQRDCAGAIPLEPLTPHRTRRFSDVYSRSNVALAPSRVKRQPAIPPDLASPRGPAEPPPGPAASRRRPAPEGACSPSLTTNLPLCQYPRCDARHLVPVPGVTNPVDSGVRIASPWRSRPECRRNPLQEMG